ncbi:hypothetical protein J437_LFUL011279 [Ladona fulva]|uniref:THO complex subunit 7 n=1 Tax=Ladona fulva TaxID=123851 RepID=A0A8K0KP05_LADFU|nr:hypothetical protein J437_LFUL011279 [Ladona fulva]
MGDEDVIRRRLLIDGDGTGDDRRLNVLLKTFIKWCNTTNEIPSESQVILDRMLSQLCQSECALARSQLVARAAEAEVNNYKRLSASVEQRLLSAREGITATLEELAQAKVVRKQRVRYDALASVISAQPDRRETAKCLAGLKAELRALEETREMLDSKLDVRRKQFHVLVSTIHQLQGMLEEGGGTIGQSNGRSSCSTPKMGGEEASSEKRGQKRRRKRRDGKRSHRNRGEDEEEDEEEEDEEEEEEPEDVNAMIDISLDAFEDEEYDMEKKSGDVASPMEVDKSDSNAVLS